MSKEQKDIKHAAREFAEGEFTPERAMELDLNHEFPQDLYKKAGELGFIGLDYPEAVEGGGLGVTETAKWIIDEAMTVFGGYGYFLDQEVERRYRDNRIAEIYEGTVEVQLNNMVRMLKKVNPEFINVNLL